jgi:hypothetical protein
MEYLPRLIFWLMYGIVVSVAWAAAIPFLKGVFS